MLTWFLNPALAMKQVCCREPQPWCTSIGALFSCFPAVHAEKQNLRNEQAFDEFHYACYLPPEVVPKY